jgi:16S rRNA (cytidine1402-2'-O)-methyltransferase
LGFPPHKNKRKKFFKEVAAASYTVAFYESSHRIEKALLELKEVLDIKKQVCVCRELTKKFESMYRGTIEEIIEMNISTKGEFVVIISS